MTTYEGRKAPLKLKNIVQAVIWFIILELMIIGVFFIPSYTEIMQMLGR